MTTAPPDPTTRAEGTSPAASSGTADASPAP